MWLMMPYRRKEVQHRRFWLIIHGKQANRYSRGGTERFGQHRSPDSLAVGHNRRDQLA